MKHLLLLLFNFTFLITFSQSRYDQPAQGTNNTQYYRMPYEPMRQALEDRQNRAIEIKQKFDALEMRIHDFQMLGEDSLFQLQLHNLLNSISSVYENMDVSECLPIYYRMNSALNTFYADYLDRKRKN